MLASNQMVLAFMLKVYSSHPKSLTPNWLFDPRVLENCSAAANPFCVEGWFLEPTLPLSELQILLALSPASSRRYKRTSNSQVLRPEKLSAQAGQLWINLEKRNCEKRHLLHPYHPCQLNQKLHCWLDSKARFWSLFIRWNYLKR